jgi:hypothetical protein
MPDTISRALINSNLPEGSAWNPAPDGDLDNLFEGIADGKEIVRDFLSLLARLRCPQSTPILSDLEIEYGIIPDDRIAEQTRRDRLEAQKTATSSTGAWDFMQEKLQLAGFSVQVHPNDPAVDPNLFLAQDFQMVADGGAAFAGNEAAFAAIFGGELIVNGDIFRQSNLILSVANAGDAFAGNAGFFAGEFQGTRRDKINYDVPADSGYWPLIFFVGGDATRDGSGFLTDIQAAEVEQLRREELIRLIIKYKPLHSWCGLIVDYV